MGPKVFAGALVIGAVLSLCGAANAEDKAIQFDVRLSGHVDCQTPRKLDNLPLSFKGKMVMSPDGNAVADVTMTAAHFISFKYKIEGGVGGGKPKVNSDGTYYSLRVVNENTLKLLLGYPTSEYTLNVGVQGERCGVQLLPALKAGQSQYSIIADDVLYLCDRFEIKPTACSVKEVKAR